MAALDSEAEDAEALPSGILIPLIMGGWSLLIVVLSFVAWAALSPPATSIPAKGHLNAPKPSYDIQQRLNLQIFGP